MKYKYLTMQKHAQGEVCRVAHAFRRATLKIGLGRFSSRYRLTPESTGLRGKHLIIPGNRLWFAKAQKTGYQKGEGCLGLGE